MVLLIAVGEFIDEPVVGVVEFGRSALRDRIDLFLAQAGLQPEPDMRRPFKLRGPISRCDKDCDFGLLRCVGRGDSETGKGAGVLLSRALHPTRMSSADIPSTAARAARASTVHLGETGEATWRRFMIGDVRVRLVEYSAGYMADHWCDLGHVLYVLEGELDTELRDGRTFKLRPGMSYQVSDHGDAAHRSSMQTGAKLFIVD